MKKKGIDISYHNSCVDFDEIKSKYDFVIIRCGYGKNHIDSKFHEYASKCQKMKIPFGVYWFSYAYTVQMAIDEANYCCDALDGYVLSYPVAIINPYYVALGITGRLHDNTHFLRGDGFVLEQGYVESASEAQKESGFNKAFAGSSYIAYSAESVYLNDNKAFVEKPVGTSRYLCTIKYKGSNFALREYAELGYIYCDDKPDLTFKTKLSVTTEDHSINYVMLRANDNMVFTLRYYFEHGCFRFKDLRCKEAVLAAISY